MKVKIFFQNHPSKLFQTFEDVKEVNEFETNNGKKYIQFKYYNGYIGTFEQKYIGRIEIPI